MTDAITDSAGLSGPITEASVPRKRAVAPRATSKAAKEAPVEVENVSIGEAEVVNDDGQNVIAGPKKSRAPRRSNSFSTSDNVVASQAADRPYAGKEFAEPEPEKPAGDKVAILSTKNMRWSEVGTISKGYNIVTKEAADKWTTLAGIRIASPEEVATHYGK